MGNSTWRFLGLGSRRYIQTPQSDRLCVCYDTYDRGSNSSNRQSSRNPTRRKGVVLKADRLSKFTRNIAIFRYQLSRSVSSSAGFGVCVWLFIVSNKYGYETP